MTRVLINTFTGERFIALPYSCNMYKIMNLETGSYFFWTQFDYEYSIESGHYELEEE